MFISAHLSLEDFWRRRLLFAQAQYEAAKANYRKALKERRDETRAFDPAMSRARQLESDALAEYERVLRIFTELTLHGGPPRNQTGAER